MDIGGSMSRDTYQNAVMPRTTISIPEFLARMPTRMWLVDLMFESMLHASRFVTLTVTADKLENSRMFLPQCFCKANGMKKLVGKNIFMASEVGVKWPVKLFLEFQHTRDQD